MRHSFFFLIVALPLIFSCSSARYETRTDSHLAVASWYGPEFHGKPTASGEKFDMQALTCAHREFPFGAIVKVTNVSKNRSVRCVVNDRGPFVSGRDIDLSYAAAKEIGLIGVGTGSVRIEYLGRDLSYVREVMYLSSKGPFTIQVGSFKEMDNALRLKQGLDLKYSAVYVTESRIDNSTFYRVRIGKFSRREEATGVAKALAYEGYSPLILLYEERV